MADLQRGTPFERDIEQAITALKKGAHLLKYGRKGKPRFCPFRLSNDEKTLIWYSGKEEMQLNLNAVSRIIPGQRTANFQRHPRPEKEYQSFSLIFGRDEQSLDLICKDKDQAELWFVGLKALINNGQSHSLQVEMGTDGLSSDGCSPVGHMQRKFNLSSVFVSTDTNLHQDPYKLHKMYGSPPCSGLGKAFSAASLYSVESRKSYPDSNSFGDSLQPADSYLGSGSLKTQAKENSMEAFRVSLSSIISSSSQGSVQDSDDALGDVYMWGEGIGDGILGGGLQRVGSSLDIKLDSFLPKHLESAVVLDVQNIACGQRHAALVNRQGEIFCWGEESGGRLGHGVDTDVPHPQLVEGLATTTIEYVACGEYHTCAVTLSGDLYTWGDGARSCGLLGHGHEVSHWMPRRVFLPEGIRVSNVACGPWHTAFVTSAGHLCTFGDGTFGALGHGDKKSSILPREVESLKGLKAIRVACGVWHTSAIVEVITGSTGVGTCSSGKLFTWGDGDKGQLGHGDKEQKLTPTCVAALVNYNCRQIACGHSFTLALTTSGKVYTMGSNAYGQLGIPHAGGLLPGLVEDKLWEAFVEEIACGDYHVAVLTSKTEIYTWGKGANGRLGHGDIQDRHTPTLVNALKDKQVKGIACGSSFSAAICLHKWVSCADQAVCSGCKMSFGFTRKRHNCYNCGQVFCHACSNRKVTKAKLAPTPNKPHRVCDPCYVKLKMAEDAGIACHTGKLKQNGIIRQSLDKERPDVRIPKTHLPSPKPPLLEQAKHIDGKLFSMQIKKPESLRRVSPAPTDQVPWGKVSMSGFLSSGDATPKAPVSPGSIAPSRAIVSVASPLTRHPGTPGCSITSPFPSGYFAQYSLLDELRKTNKGLNQEMTKLLAEVEALTCCCQAQEVELRHAEKEFQDAKALAAEEAAKCKAAKEVIKSLTLQLKCMANKLPLKNLPYSEVHANRSPRFDVPNEYHAIVTEVVDPAEVGGTELNDRKYIPKSTIQVVRDAEANGSTGHFIMPNGGVQLPNLTMTRQLDKSALARSAAPLENERLVEHHLEQQWVEQDEPGVYITFTAMPGGGKDLKRVRFSRKKFSERQAEQWWAENRARVYEQYNIRGFSATVSGISISYK